MMVEGVDSWVWQQWNWLKLTLSNHETSASTSFPSSSSQCKRVSAVMLFPWSFYQFESYLLWLLWLWDHTELPSFSLIQLQPSTVMRQSLNGLYLHARALMVWYDTVSGCVSDNHADARVRVNIRVCGFLKASTSYIATSMIVHVDFLPLHCTWADRLRLVLQVKHDPKVAGPCQVPCLSLMVIQKEIQIFYQKICSANKPPIIELFNRLSTQWIHIIFVGFGYDGAPAVLFWQPLVVVWLRLQEHSWAHCIFTKTSCEVMSISCKRYPSLSIQAASPSIDKCSRFCSSFGRPDVPTMQGYIAGHPFVARHDPKTDPTSYKHVLMIIAIPACDLASWPGFNLTLASLCLFHYSQYNTIQYALTKKCTGPNQRQTAFVASILTSKHAGTPSQPPLLQGKYGKIQTVQTPQ